MKQPADCQLAGNEGPRLAPEEEELLLVGGGESGELVDVVVSSGASVAVAMGG